MKKQWLPILLVSMMILSSFTSLVAPVFGAEEVPEGAKTKVEELGPEEDTTSELSEGQDPQKKLEGEDSQKNAQEDKQAPKEDESKDTSEDQTEEKQELAREEALEAQEEDLTANQAEETAALDDAIYLDGEKGKDTNFGFSPETPVQTLEKAESLVKEHKQIQKIYVQGTVDLKENHSLEGSAVTIYRADNFKGYLFKVGAGKTASLENIKIDGREIPAEKSLIYVEGALNIGQETLLQNNHTIILGKNKKTFGGAVYVYGSGSQLTMTAGQIQNNTATFGGGIAVRYGGNFNFSGGTIQGNRAISGDISSYDNDAASGGGVCIDKKATMTMTGSALVQGNSSEETGGGIAIGSQEISDNGNNTFTMTGGRIEGNQSGACGGGIFMQAGYSSYRNKAYISAGEITNNHMLGTGKMKHVFGGGGIYVNGFGPGYNFYNGELYLTNAIITENKAKRAGGGYAACPVSLTKIYLRDGAAIYGNQASKAQDLFVYATMAEDYGAHVGDPEYDISPRMLGGKDYQWMDANGLVPYEKLKGTLSGDKNESLQWRAGQTDNQDIYPLGKVIISGNTSTTSGGGIGSNGSVFMGTEDGKKKSGLKKVGMKK
ncbi:conserved domain protein [Peptoniphilus sp. oral taxon 375 str. F0436]|nr:conserved domain protein [Peptoniphilus sp. oral taxon 375 str. F0436]